MPDYWGADLASDPSKGGVQRFLVKLSVVLTVLIGLQGVALFFFILIRHGWAT